MPVNNQKRPATAAITDQIHTNPNPKKVTDVIVAPITNTIAPCHILANARSRGDAPSSKGLLLGMDLNS